MLIRIVVVNDNKASALSWGLLKKVEGLATERIRRDRRGILPEQELLEAVKSRLFCIELNSKLENYSLFSGEKASIEPQEEVDILAGQMLPLAQYIQKIQKLKVRKKEVIIYIPEKDFLSYSIACYLSSGISQQAKAYVTIRDTSSQPLPYLCPPDIKITRAMVLLAILLYRKRSGCWPAFQSLSQEMFKIYEKSMKAPIDPKGNRHWTSSKDNKMINTLYASLKVLRQSGLIEMEQGSDHRKIIKSIRLTFSGMLAIACLSTSPLFCNEYTNADLPEGTIEMMDFRSEEID